MYIFRIRKPSDLRLRLVDLWPLKANGRKRFNSHDLFCFAQDLSDLNTIESKWENLEAKKTPELDHMDLEQYQVAQSPFTHSRKED